MISRLEALNALRNEQGNPRYAAVGPDAEYDYEEERRRKAQEELYNAQKQFRSEGRDLYHYHADPALDALHNPSQEYRDMVNARTRYEQFQNEIQNPPKMNVAEELQYASNVVGGLSPEAQEGLKNLAQLQQDAYSVPYWTSGTIDNVTNYDEMIRRAKLGQDLKTAREEFKKNNNLTDEQLDGLLDFQTRLNNKERNYLLNSQAREAVSTGSRASQIGNAAALTGLSILTSPFRGIAALTENEAQKRLGRSNLGTDIYAPGYEMQNMANAARGAVGERIENSRLGSAGRTVYEAGLSSAESLYRGAIAAGTGIAPEISTGRKALNFVANKGLGALEMLPTIGADAYASAYQNARQRGLSDENAQATAIASGLIEVVTEAISLENWFSLAKGNSRLLRKPLMAFLSQNVAEGSEEFFSEGLNAIADWLINKGESEYSQAVNAYMSDGMSEQEAKKQAQRDVFKDAAVAFGGGALAGAMGGAGATAVGLYNTNRQARQMFDQNTDYAELAESIDTDEANYKNKSAAESAQHARELSEKLNQKKANGEKISNSELRDLYWSMMDAVETETEARQKDKTAEQNPAETAQDLTDNVQAAPENAQIAPENAQIAPENAQPVADQAENASDGQNTNESKPSAATENIKVPEKYKAPRQTRQETYKRISSAQSIDEMAAVLQEMQESGDQEAIREAQSYFDVFSGKMAKEQNLTDAQINDAKERPKTRTSAYVAGYKGLQVAGLSPELQEAYNEGKIAAAEGPKAQASEKRMLNNYAANYATAGERRAFLNTYKPGSIVERHKIAFDTTFDAGRQVTQTRKDLSPDEAYQRGWNKLIEDHPEYVRLLGEDTVRNMFDAGIMQSAEDAHTENVRSERAILRKKGTGKFTDFRANPTQDIASRLIDAFASASGLDMELREDLPKSVNGYYDERDSKIVLNAKSGKVMTTLSHEFFEFANRFNTEEFKPIIQDTMTALREILGETGYQNLRSEYTDRYEFEFNSEEGKTLQDLDKEIAADMFMDILADDNGLERLMRAIDQNHTMEDARTIKQRIADFISEIIDKFKDLLSGERLSDTQRKALDAGLGDMNDLRQRVIDAAQKAVKNYHEAKIDGYTVETNASPMVASMDVRSSLEYATMPSEETITMKALPFDATVLFTGTDEEIEQYEKAEKEAEDKWKGIVEDPSFVALQVNLGRGRVKILSPSVRGGLFQLTNVQDGEPTSHSLYGTGEGHSGDDYWHPMEDLYRELFLMHANKDKKVDVLRASLDKVPTRKRFSMDDKVEQTRDLIAVHNLTADQLLADIELGGLPSPSIAVVRAGMEHSSYGDVSLIFGKETIDPKASKKNKVYSGDAWTPTFPTVEYKLNSKKVSAIENRINELVPYEYKRALGHISLDETNMSQMINSFSGNAVNAYNNNDVLKYAFLKDKGVDIKVQTRERALSSKLDNSMVVELAKLYSAEEFEDMRSNLSSVFREKPEVVEAIRTKANELYRQKYAQFENEEKPYLRRLFEKDYFEELYFSDFANFIDAVTNYNEYGIQTEPDPTKLRDAVQDQTNQEEFEKWLADLFDGVIEKKGIRNSKEVFTRSGNRRSWDQLHDDMTLENIVKVMNAEESKGANAFFAQSAIQAIATKNFSSIEDIRKSKGQLRMVSEEEHKALQDEHANRFREIAEHLLNKSQSNEFMAFDDAASAIADAMRQSKTAAGIEKYLKKWYGDKAYDGIGQDIVDLSDSIANMPTGYFEAKPRRAVYLNEVQYAIVPDNVTDDFRKRLDEAGIVFIPYEAGNEDARTNEINNLQGIRFSVDAADGSAADNVKKSDYSYDTLVAKNDIQLYEPGSLGLKGIEYSEELNANDVIELAKNNIKMFNAQNGDAKYGDGALYNSDLGRYVKITRDGLKHGLKWMKRANTDAQTYLPAYFRNAIVVNEAGGERNGANKSYVLFGAYMIDGKPHVARVLVNHYDGGYFAEEFEDVLYATRTKKDEAMPIGKPVRNNSSSGWAPSKFTIAHLLSAVKEFYPNELPEDVANRLRYERKASEIKGLRYSVEASKDTAGRELTQGQQEYFAESKVRDENGNLKVMYHGTPQGGFTVFKNDLTFFTEDKDYANRYRSVSASSRNSRKESSNPQTYEVYLNMKNPFDIRDAAIRRQFINEYVKGGYALGINPYTEYKDVTESGLPSWEEADNIYEWMEENDLLDTYDGILVDEGGVPDDNGGVLHRGVAYITFNSNQIKNVDNQNPTDNPDIRMSVNGEENGFDFGGDNNRVRNEGAKILELGAEALKNQEVDRKTVRKIASDLRARYGSRYNLTAFTDNMERVFAYAQSGDFVNYRDLMKVLEEVARPVIEEAGELVGQERYDEFMGAMKGYTIALTPNQKKEVISTFGSYQNFRNAMGGIRIANNGTSLDSIWDEICDRVPGLERDTVEGDQPEALYDMLQAMKPTVKNGYGMDMEEAARDLSLQIVEKYYEEAGKKNSKVAAAAEQMKKQNEEYRKDLKDTYLKRFNEAKQAMGAHYDKETAELRARLKKRAQDAKTRREQADQVRVIRKEAGELLNWAANPNKEHHVMNSMLEPVMDLLSALDFATPRVERTTVGYQARVWDPSLHRFQTIDGNTYTEVMEKVEQAIQQGGGSAAQRKWADRMSSIRDIFDKVRNNDSFEQRDRDDFLRTISPELADQLKDVIDRNKDVVQLSDLGVEDLKVIKNVIKNVKHAVSVENKAFTNNVDLTNIAQGILKESEDTKNLRADRSKAGNFAVDNVIIANMTPDTYFDVIHAGEVNKILRSAAEKKMANIRKIVDAKDKIFAGIDQKDIQKWDSPKSLKTYKVADGTLQMTDAQVMYLYEMNKRQQAKLHQPGGITIEKMEMSSGPFAKQKAQSKAVHLSEAEIKKITDTLTTQQKELADRMQVFLADDCAKMGNEATLKMYGYEVFGDPNYMPLRSDQNVISMQSRENVGVTNAIANMGFTKQVNLNARNALVVSSIFDIFTKHTADMATYNAYAPAIADALRIYNYKDVYTENGSDTAYTVQYAIQQMLGDKGKEYFEKLIKDINARERSDYIPSLTDALTSNYKVAAIAGNIRVVVQQPTAIMRAGMLINPKYLLKGLSSVTNINKTKERMLNTSELAWWKSQGYYETNIGPSMKALITGEQSTKEKIQEKALAAAGAADDITWSVIFSAVEDEVSDQFKAKGKSTKTEEYKQAVKERFHDILWQTQVFDATLGRSEYMRSSDRRNIMAASFMAEPTKTFNMMLKPWYQAIRSAEGTGAKKIVSAAASKGVTKSAYYFVMTSALNAAATAFIDAFRKAGKADEEDEYGKRYANAFRENFIDNVNPLKLLPIIKDLYELVESGYKALVKGESTFGSSSSTNMELEAINSAISAMTDINKYREGEGTKTLYGVINSTIRALSQLTGVPVYNINRDVTAVYNTAREKFTDLPDLFETSTTNRKTKAKNGVFKAIEEGGDYKKAIRESVEAGNRLDTMASTITSEYKEQYVELLKTNPSEAKKLENRLEAIYKYLAQVNKTEYKPRVKDWPKDVEKAEKNKEKKQANQESFLNN